MRVKIMKKILISIWVALLLSTLVAYIFFPKIVNIEHLFSLIEVHYSLALLFLFIFVSLRGLVLISPLIVTVASLVFFPAWPVFIINSIGILISSFIVYKFSDYLGFDEYFEKNYKDKVDKIKSSLDKKEIPIMTAWSFLPFFPTDLLVYAGASLRISLWKILVSIFIGTTLINAITVFSLQSFWPTVSSYFGF